LGTDIVGRIFSGETAAGDLAERHRGVEVAPRDMADCVGHRENCQTECESDAEEADTPGVDACGQHRTTATAEDEDKSADTFGYQPALHEDTPYLMLLVAPYDRRWPVTPTRQATTFRTLPDAIRLQQPAAQAAPPVPDRRASPVAREDQPRDEFRMLLRERHSEESYRERANDGESLPSGLVDNGFDISMQCRKRRLGRVPIRQALSPQVEHRERPLRREGTEVGPKRGEGPR
jgi:hypothetical protein